MSKFKRKLLREQIGSRRRCRKCGSKLYFFDIGDFECPRCGWPKNSETNYSTEEADRILEKLKAKKEEKK